MNIFQIQRHERAHDPHYLPRMVDRLWPRGVRQQQVRGQSPEEIIGHDLDFADQLPKLMPHKTELLAREGNTPTSKLGQ